MINKPTKTIRADELRAGMSVLYNHRTIEVQSVTLDARRNPTKIVFKGIPGNAMVELEADDEVEASTDAKGNILHTAHVPLICL